MKYSTEFLGILKTSDIREDLRDKDFISLYEEIPESLIPQFTHFCYEVLKVDPLRYMNYIPKSFLYGSDIEEFTIPNGMERIDDLAFYSCKSLVNVVIADSVINIGAGAFANCPKLTTIIIPDSVTNISRDAFSSCTSLTNLTIGNNVLSIDNYVLYHCDSLKSIKYNGTKEQWENIYKRGDWNYESCATKVICTDGEIDL
jgi:hypothetical protein